jgi:hypothetical protein
MVRVYSSSKIVNKTVQPTLTLIIARFHHDVDVGLRSSFLVALENFKVKVTKPIHQTGVAFIPLFLTGQKLSELHGSIRISSDCHCVNYAIVLGNPFFKR